jgi:hypothetical protein
VDTYSGSCPVTITRHWTFRDADGNEETCTQTIIVTDTQAPVLSCSTTDVTVDCNSIPEPWDCTATDNCDGDVPVTMTEEVDKGTDCETGYTLTRTYTATDECGNTATAEQRIHVYGMKGMGEKGMMQSQVTTPILDVSVAPNPFRHETMIQFTTAARGHASVVIMDMLGHPVQTLMDADVDQGQTVKLEFNPGSASGALYFYRILLNGSEATGKIMYRP